MVEKVAPAKLNPVFVVPSLVCVRDVVEVAICRSAPAFALHARAGSRIFGPAGAIIRMCRDSDGNSTTPVGLVEGEGGTARENGYGNNHHQGNSDIKPLPETLRLHHL